MGAASGAHEPVRALLGTTVVLHERGRWVVHTVVIFSDRVVVHRIHDHHTLRRAELAASLIERAMNRA